MNTRIQTEIDRMRRQKAEFEINNAEGRLRFGNPSADEAETEVEAE